jgi:hypothetical protein
MTFAEMTALLAVHGARAVPMFHPDTAAPAGFMLHGPRGNKKCVFVTDAGWVDGFSVKLWCDGIAYGDKRAAEKCAKQVRS